MRFDCLCVAEQIADEFNRRRVRKLDPCEFIFDDEEELDLVEPLNSEIVAQVCFISNAACVDPEITGDELTQFVGSAIRHGHVSRAFAAPQRGPSSVCGMLQLIRVRKTDRALQQRQSWPR